MYHYFLTLFCILLVWNIVRYLKWRRDVYDPIEKIKGPKRYPFVGTLYVFRGATRADIYRIMRANCAKYGPFFRTWKMSIPEIHLMTPEHFEQIMTSSVLIKKASGYKYFSSWLGDGLLLSYGAKWHQRRKMITPTFHFKILESFMHVFQEKSKILVKYLEERCDGKPFDVYPYINHCALDIICGAHPLNGFPAGLELRVMSASSGRLRPHIEEIVQENKYIGGTIGTSSIYGKTAMGVSVNAMSDRNNSYTQAIYSTTILVVKRLLTPLQMTRLYSLMPEGKQFNQNLKIMHDFTKRVIADRRKLLMENPQRKQSLSDILTTQKKRLSFLDLLIDASDKLSDADIREEVDTFMFEGHDTTTAAVCWCLLLLANHPDIQEKVYEEIKSVLQDKRAPETISELNELKYLECCVKEALRLYPSVPAIGRTLTEDVVIDGLKVPKGTDCGLHIFELHRNPDVYPDPEKFDPDRFLPENNSKRHPYAYVPFSAGPRNCIGQKFAMYEEKTMVASVVRSYKILPVDTLESLTLVFEIILRPLNGINIMLEKRTD